ncbi:MAG: NPP1 family protein [Janthinobacterium lividum]
MHDWEHVVVWTKNNDTTVAYVSSSKHSTYESRGAGDVLWDGTHPKIVYAKDGGTTHFPRFANGNDDPPENRYHAWRRPDLVSWNGFPSTQLRDTLANANFGSATFALKDSAFSDALGRAMSTIQNRNFDFRVSEDQGTPYGVPAMASLTGIGGKCVDIADIDSAANKAAAQLWNCETFAGDQKWTYDGGTQQLKTMGRCLDVDGAKTYNFSAVTLYDCSSALVQKWTWRNGSLVNGKTPYRCLDVPHGNTFDGNRLQIFDCNGAPAQKFTLN